MSCSSRLQVGEDVPEVEQVAALAALVEGAELGGHQLLDLERAHVGVAGPPAGVHRVGTGDAWQEGVGLGDVRLDLHSDAPGGVGGLRRRRRCEPSDRSERCRARPAQRRRRRLAGRSGRA